MALTKVSGGILDPGINVAGIVTATGFDGPFTGGSSKNITAGIITATGFDLNGNGDISGNLVIGGNLTANGDFTTLNTTLREVEILRVDADTTATAGIITQRGSGDIFSVYDTSTEVFKIADGGQVTLTSTDSGAAAAPTLRLQRDSSSPANQDILGQIMFGGKDSTPNDEQYAMVAGKIIQAGAGGEHGAIQITTRKNSAHVITANLTSTDYELLNGTNLSVDGDITGNGNFLLRSTDTGSAAAPELTLHRNSTSPANNDHLGEIHFRGKDNVGSSADYATITGKILSTTNGAERGILEFTHLKSGAETVTGRWRDDSLQLLNGTNFSVAGTSTFNDDVTFQTTNGNNIFIDKSDNSIRIGDSVTQYLGNDNDMWIMHNGSTGYVHNVTGGLYVRNEETNGHIYIQGKSGDDSIIAKYEGAVELYHNGTRMFRTTAEGAIVSNISNNYGLDLNGVGNNTAIRFNSTGSSPSHSYRINFHSPTGTLFNSPCLSFDKTATNGNFSAHIAGISDDGFHLADDKKVHLGGKLSSGDFQIYHSSSDNNSYIKEVGSGDLLIQATQIKLQDASGSDYLRGFTGGAVYLHNAGSNKFETTSTGVHVTGEVSASQDYPNFRPTLDFNFAAEKKLDPRIVYYRTGPASFTDEFGKVVLVGGNTPRFDHDPTTKECKGLLMEATRTNYVRVSTNLESEWITGNGGFAVDNTITNPDGSVGAYYHTGGELYHQDIDLSGANTNTITVSLWVKERSGQSGNLDIEIFQQITGSAISMGVWSFNPATEVISTAPSTYSDGKVVKYPNGWYRVSAKATTASGNFSSTTRFDMQTAEHFVWGMQIEVGSFPTSFIPTYGSTVTRGNEHAVIDEDDFTDFYNPVESSVLAVGTMQRPAADQLQLNILHIGNSNEDGHGIFREHGTKDVWYHIRNNNTTPSGGNLNPSGFGDWDAEEEARIAIAFKDGDQAISVNGGNQVTATVTSSYPTANITKMWIGSHGNGSYFEGHIKRIAYYPKQLTDNQLNTLTA